MTHDVEQAAAVDCWRAAELGDGFFVATTLTLAASFAIGQPNERMKPPERLSQQLQQTNQMVTAPYVNQLMNQNGFYLSNLLVDQQRFRQQHGWLQESKARWPHIRVNNKEAHLAANS